MDDQLLVLPTQRVGCSEHHMGFPGSLTLAHETFRLWVHDVLDSVARHGFTRLLLLNGHGGNSAICAVLGEQLGQRHPDVQCLVTNWWSVAASRLGPLQEGPLGSVGHACEFETSVLLAIAPDTVDMSQAADGGIQYALESMQFDLIHRPAVSCYRPFHVLSESGVFGKPSLASAEKGERILADTVTALRELITGFWPDSPGTTTG
jgi:creatinine amidohydrolase